MFLTSGILMSEKLAVPYKPLRLLAGYTAITGSRQATKVSDQVPACLAPKFSSIDRSATHHTAFSRIL
ncbi:hypothetical protein M407DRAFT_31543, partial [Tulasnella calospora MUT 4182]